MPLIGWNESKKAVKRALEKLKPSLVISVERPGVTQNGRYYNMHGEDITKFTAKFDLFFKYGNYPEAIANYLVKNGCVDGVTSRQELSEDGFPIAVGISIINRLRNLI